MGLMVLEEEGLKYVDGELEKLVKGMERMGEGSEEKRMKKWVEREEVCERVKMWGGRVERVGEKGSLGYREMREKT